MLVKTNLIFKGYDAFTVYPFIFIRPTRANDQALVAHEKIHYREQRKALVLPWFWRYFTNRDFRLRAELRGYVEQIRLGGIGIWEAAQMLDTYDTGRSQEELRRLLQDELKRTVTTPDLYTLVGSNGQARIEIFRQMEAGWDHGRGEALKLESLRKANEWAQGIGYRMDVSVFMSTDGNIVLNWHDPLPSVDGSGKIVELEFGEVVSVYIEKTGVEFRALYGDPAIPKPPANTTT